MATATQDRESTATMLTSLTEAAGSLSVNAEEWFTITAAGSCACCAARFAGCRDPAVYNCDERVLNAELNARFADESNGSQSRGLSSGSLVAGGPTCCTLCLGLLQLEVPILVTPRVRSSSELHGDDKRSCVIETVAAATAAGVSSSPASLSASSSFPRQQQQQYQQRHAGPTSQMGTNNDSNNNIHTNDSNIDNGQEKVPDLSSPSIQHASKLAQVLPPPPIKTSSGSSSMAAATPASSPNTVRMPPSVGIAAGPSALVEGGSDYGRRRASIVDTIAESATSRGYTVSSFCVTAAVPACFAVRDAAFILALKAQASKTGDGDKDDTDSASNGVDDNIGDDVGDRDTNLPSKMITSASYSAQFPRKKVIDTPPIVVPVKEALKLKLIGGLQSKLGRAEFKGDQVGAKYDADSDFVVEITAKAPEADAHAMKALLGGPALYQGAKKPQGWPGAGRWAKKRQRREEHRNPGLTVGAVKKSLAELDDSGRDRMIQWVEGLQAKGRRGVGVGTREAAVPEVTESMESKQPVAGVGTAAVAAAAVTEKVMDVMQEPEEANSLPESEGEGTPAAGEHMNGGDAATAAILAAVEIKEAHVTAASSPTSPPPPIFAPTKDGARENGHEDNQTLGVKCEITIRRQPIHFWGRYTKLSRTVPQTPWMKGFYSVQEAVSEPFESCSGCVEGLLHGAGREDVDVRMLGKGRPFSLELIDSLRTVGEIEPSLPALMNEINAGTGLKNAGGGVRVSRLRVAGPAELPSDVQRVGEGKRKHYRCVVWVSRAVGKDEVMGMCDRGELVVQQGTPVRVLHRRTLMDRPRSIFNMSAEWINEHFFALDLTTSAGDVNSLFVLLYSARFSTPIDGVGPLFASCGCVLFPCSA